MADDLLRSHHYLVAPPGGVLPDAVADDSLPSLPRQQTLPSRWQGEQWGDFVDALSIHGIKLRCQRYSRELFAVDAGGLAYGLATGVLLARSIEEIATLLQVAQRFAVPVTVRGGGLSTEGESIAYGGVLLDMSALQRVLEVDVEGEVVRVEGGICWHALAETLRRYGMDYLSAPLNMSSTVGAVIGVGGVDVNSMRFGCSADQVESLTVVTPTGEVEFCSDDENSALFQRVILGYGQFGVVVEATLRIRKFSAVRMSYLYYQHLPAAIADMQMLNREQACDYCAILTMMDRVITLLVAFDSRQREERFLRRYRAQLRGLSEQMLTMRLLGYYGLHPWRWREALFLARRKAELLPDLQPAAYMRDGALQDRSVVFSRAVWKHWGGRKMVIPDIATSSDSFVDAVMRGNEVCRRYFPYYTLYCVGIRLREEHRAHYELSSIPPNATGFAYGCEFEPMLHGQLPSRDLLQSFKNEIYGVGLDLGGSFYRFGGMMKGYIRRAFGDTVVDRHLAMKRRADPAFILNRDTIF
ncbi:MAG: FAD-binding oxidoreductase [Mariprofundales bacterium]|nr:FAD-binding oxidoreductase [Mariprofundales bacterium]